MHKHTRCDKNIEPKSLNLNIFDAFDETQDCASATPSIFPTQEFEPWTKLLAFYIAPIP